jgi:hypothetical protein
MEESRTGAGSIATTHYQAIEHDSCCNFNVVCLILAILFGFLSIYAGVIAVFYK